jgi:hypothetical protein
MHGPRSARRRRAHLGFGQIPPTGALAGRPGRVCLRYPAIIDGRTRRATSAASVASSTHCPSDPVENNRARHSADEALEVGGENPRPRSSAVS